MQSESLIYIASKFLMCITHEIVSTTCLQHEKSYSFLIYG